VPANRNSLKSARGRACLTTTILLFSLRLSAQTNAPSTGEKATPGGSDPLTEARTLYRDGHLDEAAQRYQQLLQAQPRSGEVYAGLTRVYLKQKMVKQAQETVSKGLAVADSPTIRVAQAEVLFREGKLAAAESEWLAVINSGHADARAYLGLARMSTATTLYEQAKREIDKAHALDPSDPDIQLYWIHSLGPSEQVAYLEEYLSHESSDSAEERTHLRNHLEYLKARLKDSSHGCRLATKLTATEADLLRLSGERLTQTRGYGLAVALNGQNSKLQLDTGASGILIDRRIAQKAGLTRLSDTTLEGLGDARGANAYFAMTKSIKVGALEFLDCPVTVVERRSVLGLDGIIGADFFQAFLIDLDLASRKLRLAELPIRPNEIPVPIGLQVENHPADFGGRLQSGLPTAASDEPANPEHTDSRERYIPPDMKSYTPVYRFGHDLLIPTMVGKDPARLFLIDTGGFMNIISLTTAREATKVYQDSRTTVKGLSGTVNKMYSADEIDLQFGQVRYGIANEATLDLVPLSNQVGTEISGVLGCMAFLHLDVRIDYRDGLVDLADEPRH
jgi:tetratricopeptide (TPR) repeat protein